LTNVNISVDPPPPSPQADPVNKGVIKFVPVHSAKINKQPFQPVTISFQLQIVIYSQTAFLKVSSLYIDRFNYMSTHHVLFKFS